MCGIAGIFDFGEKREFDASRPLWNMLEAIKHRGPDDRGEEFIIGNNGTRLWLGHQRLSIIDLSKRGHQPMANFDKSLWIISNGEIYNFRELRSELKSRFNFVSESDTEVLLRSYEVWGKSCVEKLRGMFAFAIWDASCQKLFLARDRFGIKPLYYYFDKNRFIFSSETRALTSSGLVPIEINKQGVFDYLAFGRLQGPDSIFSGVCELPPGCYLEVDASRIYTPVQYWKPLDREPFQGNEKDLTGCIQDLLLESVRYRLVSDVPVGTFLSGGIDSSSLTGLLSCLLEAKTRTISVIFKEKDFNEFEFSSQVAKAFNTDHQTLLLEKEDLLNALPSVIAAMDQPTVDGVNTYLISRSARSSGLKVVLSGLGGDELFAGYDSFFKIPGLARWDRFFNLIPNGSRKVLGHCLAGVLPDSDKYAKLAQWIGGNNLGCHVYYLFRNLFGLPSICDLILDQETITRGMKRHMESTQAEMILMNKLDDIQKISWLELNHYMSNMLLRDSDVMSMAHGLELRVPLIDHKLVEFMMSVPGNMKMKPGRTKPLLVDSLPCSLPKKTVNREKMGFTLPFDIWMKTCLREDLEKVLLSPVRVLGDILSDDAVEQVWKNFLGGKTSWSRPWSLYILKKWAERNAG